MDRQGGGGVWHLFLLLQPPCMGQSQTWLSNIWQRATKVLSQWHYVFWHCLAFVGLVPKRRLLGPHRIAVQPLEPQEALESAAGVLPGVCAQSPSSLKCFSVRLGHACLPPPHVAMQLGRGAVLPPETGEGEGPSEDLKIGGRGWGVMHVSRGVCLFVCLLRCTCELVHLRLTHFLLF